MRWIVTAIIWIILATLMSCASTTGLKDHAAVIEKITQLRDTNSVFVLRDTGYNGSASAVEVRLNDLSFGTIGDREVAVGKARLGENLLWADFTMFGTSGPARLKFESNDSSNHFFIMMQSTSFLEFDRRLLEVDEEQFRSFLK